MRHLSLVFALVSLGSTTRLTAGDVATPDLKALIAGQGWRVENRSVQALEKDHEQAVQFDGRVGDGMAWLENFSFDSGEIECDLLGRSQPIQGSFVGIAFRIRDARTFDAAYLRPFNFRSPEAARRSHSIQYVSHPEWTWSRLRNERTGQFENAIDPAPDGDQWIHLRIVVERPKVRVYVNGAAEPSLVVDELSGRTGGSVGLFLGNGSPGSFANLKITRK
jgi:hypothetical protein